VNDPFFPATKDTMTIPNAEQIEGAADEIRSEAAASAAEHLHAAKELHVADPALLRNLTASEFALVARGYFLGLKVAKYMIDSGARL
jgi:hypothetical protein